MHLTHPYNYTGMQRAPKGSVRTYKRGDNHTASLIFAPSRATLVWLRPTGVLPGRVCGKGHGVRHAGDEVG